VAVGRLFQMNESCRSGRETARSVVEVFEMIGEIHVQPFAPSPAGFFPGHLNQLGAYASGPNFGGHHGVLNPCMNSAIRDHVYESDQATCIACCDPAQAVLGKKSSPVPLVFRGHCGLECLGMKRVDLNALNVTPPLADNRHRRSIPASGIFPTGPANLGSLVLPPRGSDTQPVSLTLVQSH